MMFQPNEDEHVLRLHTDDQDCGGVCKKSDNKITNDKTGTLLMDRLVFFQVRLKTVLTCPLKDSYWSPKLSVLATKTSPPKVTPVYETEVKINSPQS